MAPLCTELFMAVWQVIHEILWGQGLLMETQHGSEHGAAEREAGPEGRVPHDRDVHGIRQLIVQVQHLQTWHNL